MITVHIKRLEFLNGTWVLELWNSQIIKGTNSLAESVEKAGEHVWPMPKLADETTIDILPEILEAV